MLFWRTRRPPTRQPSAGLRFIASRTVQCWSSSKQCTLRNLPHYPAFCASLARVSAMTECHCRDLVAVQCTELIYITNHVCLHCRVRTFEQMLPSMQIVMAINVCSMHHLASKNLAEASALSSQLRRLIAASHPGVQFKDVPQSCQPVTQLLLRKALTAGWIDQVQLKTCMSHPPPHWEDVYEHIEAVCFLA